MIITSFLKGEGRGLKKTQQNSIQDFKIAREFVE